MKKIFAICICGLFLFMTSCKDDTKAPIITFDQAGKGAYVKLLNVTAGQDGYDLSLFSSTTYDFEVEFVDEQQGDLVATYTTYVSYKSSPFSTTPDVPEVLFATVDAGSFGESERGFKSTSLSVPLSTVAGLLNLTADDLGGADVFQFRSEIILQDGSVFQASNSSAAVNGSAFAGHFNFSVKLSCPLPDSDFVGAYTLTHVSGDWAFGVAPFESDPLDVTLEIVNSTKRKFSYEYIADLGVGAGDVDFIFDIVCKIIVPDEAQGTGLGCGGTIRLGPNPDSFGSVDITDDSSFVIDLIDWADDGGCGVPEIPLTIRFDKM